MTKKSIISLLSAVLLPIVFLITLLALLDGDVIAQGPGLPDGSGIAIIPGTAAPASLKTARAMGTNLGTAFTYQGRLIVAGAPANGTFDFQFRLFDAPSAGNLLGTATFNNLHVADGLFSAPLDFGPAPFSG
ncbi:MAG: hypothetical protein D6791_12070, partial [Chloroflexi bacterium]